MIEASYYTTSLGLKEEFLSAVEEEDLIQTASRFARVRSVLERVARSDNRQTVLAELAASGHPLYESDPENPEGVIQVDCEGNRVAGCFEGRRFVPSARKVER